jgi:hypothetical protein
MQRHWLLIDIGNTHTVAGLALPGSGAHDTAEIRFRTDPHATSDEYRLLLTQLLRQKWAEFEWSRVERADLERRALFGKCPSPSSVAGSSLPLHQSRHAPRV